MWRSISLGFFVIGVAYTAFSRAPSLLLAMLCVFLAHMGASNNWVVSTALLQMNTDDRFRGRVFAVDYGANMLMAAVSNYVLGVGLDVWHLGVRQLAMGLGIVMMIPAVLWLPAQAKWGKEKNE